MKYGFIIVISIIYTVCPTVLAYVSGCQLDTLFIFSVSSQKPANHIDFRRGMSYGGISRAFRRNSMVVYIYFLILTRFDIQSTAVPRDF